MVRGLSGGRSSLPSLVGAVALALACGAGTDGAPGSPGTTTDPAAGGDTPSGAGSEAPGPWAPSRALALDRFALETALGSALGEPAGAELSESTVWTLTGESVEVRLEVSTWFSGAEAEAACRAAAGDGATSSLSLGTPTWATQDAVHVTLGEACVKVNVLRGRDQDVAGAAAVVAALVAPQ